MPTADSSGGSTNATGVIVMPEIFMPQRKSVPVAHAQGAGNATAPAARVTGERCVVLLELLGSKPVKFAVAHAAKESVPFVGGKPENRSCGVPAVADADLAIGQARHLNTVAVREA